MLLHEPGDEYRLAEQLQLLGRKLALADKYDAACCGTTIGQCRALREIGRNPGLNTNQLAEKLNVDKSTVSRTIDQLVKQYWVVRRPDQRDRRYTILDLSREGQAMLLALEMQIVRYHQGIFRAIPENKRGQVAESIDLLLNALQKMEQDTGGGSICC